MDVPTDKTIVLLAGYYYPDDGGAGLFYWDSASREGDNGGTIITPGANPSYGRWKRLLTDDRVNVKWFGAKGTQTDDTLAIQAAIDSLPPRGGTVYFPGGDYRISQTIVIGDGDGGTAFSTRNGIKLVGEGAGFAVYDPYRVPTMITAFKPMPAVIDVRGRICDVHIEDIFISGALQADVGIKLQAISGTVLKNLKVAQFKEIGLLITGGAAPTGNYNIFNQFDNLSVASTQDGHIGLYMDGDYGVQNDTWLSSFRTCRFDTASAKNAIGAWFKFVDSISFYRCHFACYDPSCIGIIFDALDNHNFPSGMAFYDCSIYSIEVYENFNHKIRKQYFYGYGTYDNEKIPTHPKLIGITDDGGVFNLELPSTTQVVEAPVEVAAKEEPAIPAADNDGWVQIYQEDVIELGPYDRLSRFEDLGARDFKLECEVSIEEGAMFTFMFRAANNQADGYGLILQGKKDWCGFYRMDGGWGLREWLKPVHEDGMPPGQWLKLTMEVVGRELRAEVEGITELYYEVLEDTSDDYQAMFLRNVLGSIKIRNLRISVPDGSAN